ncbi:phosphoglycerate mutase family protein [Trichoderma barbatum]
MECVIYLIRHAEAEHNITKDFSQRDPPLTPVGFEQASSLAKTFPEPSSIAVVLSSPLKRALQTTIAGFSHILALNGVSDGHQNGSARLIIDRDLQERSDLPCDMGSERAVLEETFPNLDFTTLNNDWFVKTGTYAADDASVILRARIFREKLWDIAKSVQTDQPSSSSQRAIVVVTHGVFMQYLSQDMNIDLPKAGWQPFLIRKAPDSEVILSPI